MEKNLPALIDEASRKLGEARTSAEVLEARAQAQAAMHYAKVTKAATETQADCMKMIVRAEMRMADEIDAGQERGELAKSGEGRSARVRDADASTYEELGLTRQRVHDFRKVRDAGQEAVDQVIDRAVSEGRAPSKAEIMREISGETVPLTDPSPPEFFAKAIHMLGYAKELSTYCANYEPHVIRDALSPDERRRLHHYLSQICEWNEDL